MNWLPGWTRRRLVRYGASIGNAQRKAMMHIRRVWFGRQAPGKRKRPRLASWIWALAPLLLN